jgi:hypothetical protein
VRSSPATIVVRDPIFGLYAYGGKVEQSGPLTKVVPMDGIRTRFHVLVGKERPHLVLVRDGFGQGKPVVFNDGLSEIAFTLENRAGTAHQTGVEIAGLPPGDYEVAVGGKPLERFSSEHGEGQEIAVLVKGPSVSVKLTRVSGAAW